MHFEIDHIDPTLGFHVSGLSVPQNLVEREGNFNSKKSNRFLPWRDSLDELGGIPVNPGDLCLFLDPDSNEWVLEEFLGDWWFEKTRSLCGSSLSGTERLRTRTGIFDKTDPRNIEGNFRGGKKGGLRGGKTTKERGVGIFDDSDPRVSRGRSEGGRKGIRRLYVSLIDGYISNSQNVSRTMRLRGQDPVLRAPLDSVPPSALIWT